MVGQDYKFRRPGGLPAYVIYLFPDCVGQQVRGIVFGRLQAIRYHDPKVGKIGPEIRNPSWQIIRQRSAGSEKKWNDCRR